jgi:hypothetical protein
MSQQRFTQCTLVKETKDSSFHQISFIPEEFAVRDNYVKIKGLDGNWSDGWRVMGCGMTLPEDQLQVYRDVHRHTRDASDA